MKQNKFIWMLIFGLFVSVGFIFFQKMILEKKLDNLGILTNHLYLERDFEIYLALQENNITRIKKDLDLNFMFHLTAIETDGIEAMLNINKMNRLCKKYHVINLEFQKEYKKTYPSTIKDLNLFCH